ncbi:Probable prolyl 4-hydroxylase [Seminavis robusta]|uniref:Probable prolyl 4-hydroxylase n=1 Tax=Seminavis robusta TaxID=568900 RepID=A0A9N8E3V3_9STRA|nr:Probable prolyl 4-hydroxylase [Seminavis robusta]|eukprot:Sro475_g150400.1 Probable prolyl 4-hydroxylase (536) ;mRNA; r:25788-27395
MLVVRNSASPRWPPLCILSLLLLLALLPLKASGVLRTEVNPEDLIGDAGADGPIKKVPLFNQSPYRLVVYRVLKTDDGAEELRILTSSEGVVPGAHVSSRVGIVGTVMMVQELPDPETGKCVQADCQKSAQFEIPQGLDPEVIVLPNLQVTVQDATIIAQQKAQEALQHCHDANDNLEDCLLQATTASLKHWNAEWRFHEYALKYLGAQVEDYVCNDDDDYDDEPMSTSPPLTTFSWESGDYIAHPVDVLHARPSSQIHVLHDFIEPEECRAVQEAAVPGLRRALVVDDQTGGAKLSQERKAWEAAITIPWHVESRHHPLTTLSRRVYDYTNYVMHLNITEHGQEPLKSIQYHGKERYHHYQQTGMNQEEEESPDQYLHHCDGPCRGGQHKVPDRVATMVMYCETATRGGHTHFRNAGVHVQPKAGMAVFFSYVDPQSMQVDTGFTEHSGCPVLEGHKHIVTQWVRLGVDKANPWDSYDALGNKKETTTTKTETIEMQQDVQGQPEEEPTTRQETQQEEHAQPEKETMVLLQQQQ